MKKEKIIRSIILAIALGTFILSCVKLLGRLSDRRAEEKIEAEVSALYPGSSKNAAKNTEAAPEELPEADANFISDKEYIPVPVPEEAAEEETEELPSEPVELEAEEAESKVEKAAADKIIPAEEASHIGRKYTKGPNGEIIITNALPQEETETEQEETLEEPAEPVFQEDFLALRNINEDIIGWLKAGENVDAPVVYLDNMFYLTHDFQKNENANGTLFVNEENSVIPRDDVLLIHGHNMNDGAMFGKLLNYENFDYLKEYPLVSFRTVYDEDEDVWYVPVAAFNASMDPGNAEYFDVLQMNFADEKQGKTVNKETKRQSTAYESYLESIREWSVWDSPADVNADDSLLMLITCSYRQDDGRFMLICRALRDGETPESIAELFQ